MLLYLLLITFDRSFQTKSFSILKTVWEERELPILRSALSKKSSGTIFITLYHLATWRFCTSITKALQH